MIYANLECLLEKMYSAKLIMKSITQNENLRICLLAICCLQIFRLMQQRISLILTEAKIDDVVINRYRKKVYITHKNCSPPPIYRTTYLKKFPFLFL